MQLPNDPLSFAYQPDPGDKLDFGIDVAALIDGEGVDLATFTIDLDADAAAAGLLILREAEYAPTIAGDGVTLVFWLAVNPAAQAGAQFNGFGIEAGIIVRFATTHVPPRTIDRTAVVTVRQR